MFTRSDKLCRKKKKRIIVSPDDGALIMNVLQKYNIYIII